MSRAIFNILESTETLLELLSQEKDGYKHKRIKALYLLKSQKAETFRGVAKILDLPAQRVGSWLKEYHKNGLQGLLSLQNKCLFRETNISESAEALLNLLEQEKDKWVYKKLQALYLLKTEKAKTSKDIAKIIEVHPQVPLDWMKKYRSNGLAGLRGNPPTRLSAIPKWAVERLVEELQEVQFLPNATTVKLWMETVLGTQVTHDIASEILASKIKPRWKQDSKQELSENPTQLSIEPEIYLDYEEWKKAKDFSSDCQALKELMYEFFDISIFPTSDASVNGEISLEQAINAILTEIPNYLNQSQLSKRLGISNAVLSKNRNKPNFLNWTKLKDPNRVAWQWVPNIRQYKSLI